MWHHQTSSGNFAQPSKQDLQIFQNPMGGEFTSGSSYMNFLIAKSISKTIDTMQKSGSIFTLNNLVKLALLISIEELKKSANILIAKIPNFMRYLIQICRTLRKRFYPISIPEIPKINSENTLQITLKESPNVICELCNFCLKNPDCASYDKIENKTIKHVSSDLHYITEIWNNILINLPNGLKIAFTHSAEITLYKTLTNIRVTKVTDSLNKITRISDLMNDECKIILDKLTAEAMKTISIIDGIDPRRIYNRVLEYYKSKGWVVVPLTSINITDSVITKYTQTYNILYQLFNFTDKIQSNVELLIYIHMDSTHVRSTFGKYFMDGALNSFDNFAMTPDGFLSLVQIPQVYKKAFYRMLQNPIGQIISHYGMTGYVSESIKYYTDSDDDTSTDRRKTTDTPNITLNLSSMVLSTSDIHAKYIEFVSTLKNTERVERRVYILGIKRIITTNTIINAKEEDNKKPDIIREEKVSLESIEINKTVKRSIDTLYLKERDKNYLIKSLDLFSLGLERLEELGLPKKLCVMLYGPAGTGKSTCIEVISTYLKKDIYYIKLKDVKKNSELQMIFDHVNKSINGGIIVCEDIDAMTPIVLKRRYQTSSPTGQFSTSDTGNISGEDSSSSDLNSRNIIGEKDELTLEYFLNVLQGSLTQDGTIFIATTNYYDRLDEAFIRDMRFDVTLKLDECDKYQIKQIFSTMIGRHRSKLNKELSNSVLNRLPDKTYTPAKIIHTLKSYILAPDTPDDIIFRDFTVL